MSDPVSDPFTVNWFAPPTPHVRFHAPSPRGQAPNSIPDIEKLYAVQDDLFDAIGALDSLKATEDHNLAVLRHRVDSAYRSIVRYLTENSAQQGGNFG